MNRVPLVNAPLVDIAPPERRADDKTRSEPLDRIYSRAPHGEWSITKSGRTESSCLVERNSEKRCYNIFAVRIPYFNHKPNRIEL